MSRLRLSTLEMINAGNPINRGDVHYTWAQRLVDEGLVEEVRAPASLTLRATNPFWFSFKLTDKGEKELSNADA